MKLGVAQMNPMVGDVAANTATLIQALQDFESHGVDLVVTPELSVMGYPAMDLVLHPSVQGRIEMALDQIRLATKKTRAGIIVGAPWMATAGRRRYNSVFLISDGQIQYRWDKQLLPFYDVFYDPRWFVSGAPTSVVEWRGRRVGVLICEDAWSAHYGDDYGVDPVAQLVPQNPDLVVVPTASPFEVNKSIQQAMVLSAVAVRLEAPVVMVNQVGLQDDVWYGGGSLSFRSDGTLMARSELSADVRDVVDSQSQVTVALPIQSDIEQIAIAIEGGIRDYVRKSGFSDVVLGLSGGIDSAVVATLAVKAIGANRVLGMIMPSEFSSPESARDANDLADRLGIRRIKVPIHSIYSEVLRELNWQVDPLTLAMENLQSRIRGVAVMAMANHHNALALSTGNKSELAMGYCTLYGDMNGALSPLSDVYKTDVFRLATWLNRDVEIIPSYTITRPPSAELRPNQTDQDSLPDYECLDGILRALIDDGLSQADIVGRGFVPDLVADIVSKCHRNEFKRRQAATGIKLSRVAFGSGRRIPILSRWVES